MRISDWSSDVCSSDLGPGRDVVGTDVPVAGQSHRAWRASEVEVFDPDAADVVADGLDQVCQTRSVRRDPQALGQRAGHFATDSRRSVRAVEPLLDEAEPVFVSTLAAGVARLARQSHRGAETRG